jgi:hypothetical protein
MKQTLGNLLDNITKILYDHNSEIMLLDKNIPEDEYDVEALNIVKKIFECDNVIDVKNIVSETFIEYFGECAVTRDQDYTDIAKEIWRLWEDYINYNMSN